MARQARRPMAIGFWAWRIKVSNARVSRTTVASILGAFILDGKWTERPNFRAARPREQGGLVLGAGDRGPGNHRLGRNDGAGREILGRLRLFSEPDRRRDRSGTGQVADHGILDATVWKINA